MVIKILQINTNISFHRSLAIFFQWIHSLLLTKNYSSIRRTFRDLKDKYNKASLHDLIIHKKY